MDFTLHVDTRLALAVLALFSPLIIAKVSALWHVLCMRKRPKAKPDVNQLAAAAVSAITGTQAESGEELLGSDVLREALREAKEKDKARQATRIKRAKSAAAK